MAGEKTDKTDKTALKIYSSDADNELSFKDAVEKVKTLFESILLTDDGETLPDHPLKYSEFVSEERGMRLLEDDPRKLIEWAENEADGLKAIKWGIAGFIECYPNKALPIEAQKWLLSFLRGHVSMPPARLGRVKEDDGTELLIKTSIYDLVACGFTATRNDVSSATSACDAVAQALLELGLTPASYYTVKGIWKNYRRSLKQFDDVDHE